MKTKSQNLAASNKFYKTKKGVLSHIYHGQRGSSKKRGHPMPDYTLNEFRGLALDTPLFHKIYDTWVASDYDTNLRPSFDRDDPNLPYTISNLVLMTWEENRLKGNQDMKDGVDVRTCRAVECFTMDEEYLDTYFSLSEAMRQTGVTTSHIARCCRFKRPSAGGFKWQYAS